MTASVQVAIHASQFPESVRRDLRTSLRTRRVNHKFHYDSVKQTQKWLALHEAHSPARYDADCRSTYDRAFAEAAAQIKSRQVQVIGLGCGGGQKDTGLIKALRARGKKISYTPCDVSVAMVLVARQAARAWLPAKKCFPFVCDLATADDLQKLAVTRSPALVTFFGMIPNFEPENILPKLSALVQKKDSLLFSANLAPGEDYERGMETILPQYDNALTRDWLMTFLLDLGIKHRDGRVDFGIEEGVKQLKRVSAKFRFLNAREIQVHGQKFKFRRGDSIRLFFSYRYTPDRVSKLLARHGLKIQDQWLAESGEEGVFLCKRS